MSINISGRNNFSFYFSNGKDDELNNIVNFKALSSKIVDVDVPGLSLGMTEMSSPTIPIYAGGSGSLTYDDLTITFLLDENWEVYKNLNNWLLGLHSNKTQTQNPLLNTTGILQILTNKKNLNFSISFYNLFPISISSFSLSSRVSTKENIEISSTFKYLKYEIE